MVVLPGWTEIGESFAEELYDLRDLGLSFYVLDHRCQGLPGGESELLFEKVMRARPHRRIVLYGNSMGGAVESAFLARYEQLDRFNEPRTEYQMGGVAARGGLESVRMSRAALQAAAKVVVADAHHVIMHETDAVRGQALAAIRSFLEEQAR
jgi:alpha-beta hydrolase superfamily lysophospholipase